MQNPSHNKVEPVIENKNTLSYPSRTLDPPITMVDRVREIEIAGNSVQSHLNAKLDIILQQIQGLQKEAKKVIEQAEEDIRLHKISCNFEKKIGMILHCYLRKNGELFFSMLSPVEWSNSPARFMGSYRIKPDFGFEKLESEFDIQK